MRKINRFLLMAFIGIVLSACGDDGSTEKWVFYTKSGGGIKILNEYNSYEECSKELKPGHGCRRIDGVFNMLNRLMD